MSSKWEPTQDDDDRNPQFQTQSQGLGKKYLSKQIINYHQNGKIPILTQSGGIILKMPRYYKEKIFTKTERQQMALEYEESQNFNFEDYLNHDYSKDVSEIKNKIRRHSKQQKN